MSLKVLVVLFWGLGGAWYGQGVTDMAARMNAIPGVQAIVYSWTDQQAAVDLIRSQPEGTPIMCVGHSLGGGACLNVARELSLFHKSVDELVAIDGRQPWSMMWIEMQDLPANVLVGIGYQTAGNPRRGVLRPSPGNSVSWLLNLRRPGTHVTVAQNAKLQREIIEDAKRLARVARAAQASIHQDHQQP